MSFTGQHRPTCSSGDVKKLLQSLGIPEPDTIAFPASQGSLNQIVVLEWAEPTLKDILNRYGVDPQQSDSPTCLLLRIASDEMPHIKLENEAATISWVASNTAIPVPHIVHHDSTTSNPLEHEYIIMTFSKGVPGSTLYPTLSTEAMDHILDQLGEHIIQLHQKPFDCVAGLKTTEDKQIIPGPFIDETQWTIPELAKHWPTTTKFEDLTPISPTGFPSFTEYLTARLTCYINAIPVHAALTSLPYLTKSNITLLTRFIKEINTPEQAELINDTRYILAHRDLHFGQLLIDPDTANITAILDWEFAAIIPAPLWQGSFLWRGDMNSPCSEEVRLERTLLRKRWEKRVAEMSGGKEMLNDAKWRSDQQEAAWDVVNLMRCIVEVVPRGNQMDDAKRWWAEILEALEVFDIFPDRKGVEVVPTMMDVGRGVDGSASVVDVRSDRQEQQKQQQERRRRLDTDAESDVDVTERLGELSVESDDVAGLALQNMLLNKPMEKVKEQG